VKMLEAAFKLEAAGHGSCAAERAWAMHAEVTRVHCSVGIWTRTTETSSHGSTPTVISGTGSMLVSHWTRANWIACPSAPSSASGRQSEAAGRSEACYGENGLSPRGHSLDGRQKPLRRKLGRRSAFVFQDRSRGFPQVERTSLAQLEPSRASTSQSAATPCCEDRPTRPLRACAR
jgi:hypothetical protein